MQILLLMNGRGERFKKAGYTTPKPFLKLQGKTLIERVLKCYQGMGQITCLVGREYVTEEFISLGTKFNLDFFILDKFHRGPAETVLESRKAIKEEEILVADCDSLISTKELQKGIDFFKRKKAQGGSPLMITEDPEVSYARLDHGTFEIFQTKEREQLSHWSTTGPYWFKYSRDLLEACTENIKTGEYHISPCFNVLISRKKKVYGYPVIQFLHLGTPEAYEKYAYHSDLEFQRPEINGHLPEVSR